MYTVGRDLKSLYIIIYASFGAFIVSQFLYFFILLLIIFIFYKQRKFGTYTYIFKYSFKMRKKYK